MFSDVADMTKLVNDVLHLCILEIIIHHMYPNLSNYQIKIFMLGTIY